MVLSQSYLDKTALFRLFLSFFRDFLFEEQNSAKGTVASFVRANSWKQPNSLSTGAWIHRQW